MGPSMEPFRRRRWRLVSAQLSKNLLIALYTLSLLLWKFINTTAYHLGRSPLSCRAPHPGSIPSDRKSIPDKIRGSNRAKIRRLKQTMMMLIRSIRLAVELQHWIINSESVEGVGIVSKKRLNKKKFLPDQFHSSQSHPIWRLYRMGLKYLLVCMYSASEIE